MQSPEQPLLIETTAHEDVLQRIPLDTHALLRLLSMRCGEAQAENLPNQDYAQLSYRQDQQGGNSLAFCVCDGVGGSYKGDFAARYLGHHLLVWLSTLPMGYGRHKSTPTSSWHTQLEAQLQRWVSKGQAELQYTDITSNISPLLSETLREQRTRYGSETVFFCGRLDYTYEQGWPEGYAIFYWMGNISAHISLSSGKNIAIGDGLKKQSDRNRWSTRHGLRGILSSQSMNFMMLDRLLVHTDGLDTLGTELAFLDDDRLMQCLDTLLLRPDNDDMTMLDLQWIA